MMCDVCVIWEHFNGRYGKTCENCTERSRHIKAVFRPMFVGNIESAKKQQSNEENIHSSTCVYLVSLDYEISVPHIIRHNRLLI